MRWAAPSLCGFAERGGFTGSDVPMAVAVALSASGGDDGHLAHPWAGSETVYVGLWQLRADAGDTERVSALRSPQRNAQDAYDVWHAAGEGWEWCPGYQSGRWRQFMGEAVAAAQHPTRTDTMHPFGSRAV